MNGETKVISAGDLFRESWGLYRERFWALTGILIGPLVVVTGGTIFAEIGSRGIALFGNLLAIFLIVLGITFFLTSLVAGEGVIVGNILASGFELFLIPFATIYFYLLYRDLKEGSPEITSESLSRSRKLLIFSGFLGVLVLVVILALVLVFGFKGGGLNEDYLPDKSIYQMELQR